MTLILGLLGLALVAPTAQASPDPVSGSLDSAFGTNGIVTTQIGSGDSDAGAVIALGSGRTIAAGVSTDGFVVARYDEHGVLDPGFGTGGISPPDSFGEICDPVCSDRVTSAVLQDGRGILVAGSSGIGIIGRLNFDGSWDGSFGQSFGRATVFGSDGVNDVAVQRNGKIVVAGYDLFGTGESRGFVARFGLNGAADPTFADHGVFWLTQSRKLGVAPGSSLDSIALQPDGKIVAVGGSYGHSQRMLAIRLTKAGRLDHAFGSNRNGRVAWLSSAYATHVELQWNRRVVIAGDSYRHKGFSNRIVLTRLRQNGDFDRSFSSDGIATSGLIDAFPTDTAIRHGRIAVLGGQLLGGRLGDTRRRVVLLRYLPDGRLDSSFGGEGVSTHRIGFDATAVSLAIEPNSGRLIVAGHSRSTSTAAETFALARFLG
ncbi:MAG: hypothetical protein U0R52_04885 [Solirubrobacterales bacterium]